MKKSTARKRNPAIVSPVGMAVARQKLTSYMTELQIELYLTDDGTPSRRLLSRLTWVLTMGFQLAFAYQRETPSVRKIHAALRSVVQLSIDGGHWPAAQAKVFHEAARTAEIIMAGHWRHAGGALADANYLSQKVLDGTARMSDVVGAEIYAKQPVCA